MSGNDGISIRPAVEADFDFVHHLMTTALDDYYGGDHDAHARRIFCTHMSGGSDHIGHFSFEQKMFIAHSGAEPVGMIHVVGKRQNTYKISPLIVVPEHRGRSGVGSELLAFAETYARTQHARQIYCTVAEQNTDALSFFVRHGYVAAGHSDSHYKPGITEVMLYKLFVSEGFDDQFDRLHISVQPYDPRFEPQVRELLLSALPPSFTGIDDDWVDALLNGYARRSSGDINEKFKLIFLAIDREDRVLGVAGATPKKGEPIKIMPLVANGLPAFVALLTDVPLEVAQYGRKVYVHLCPTVEHTIALQQRGWQLDAAMPAAYHEHRVTQQWSFDVSGDLMRTVRLKQQFLDMIKLRQKTLEVRVGYPNIKTIRAGERIRFMSRADELVVEVKAVRRYPTFDEMLEVEDPSRIAPHLPTREQLAPLLHEIYPPEREELGVIVLEIEPQQGA